jgi:hypothetical protein
MEALTLDTGALLALERYRKGMTKGAEAARRDWPRPQTALTPTVAKRPAQDYASRTMQPLKARVHNGRLLLDAPTDLPEGEVVYLQPMEGIVADEGDDLDDEERAALHAELEASIAEADRGETEDFGRMLTELRHRP